MFFDHTSRVVRPKISGQNAAALANTSGGGDPTVLSNARDDDKPIALPKTSGNGTIGSATFNNATDSCTLELMQEDMAFPLEGSAIDEIVGLFRSGKELYDAREYTDALEKFQNLMLISTRQEESNTQGQDAEIKSRRQRITLCSIYLSAMCWVQLRSWSQALRFMEVVKSRVMHGNQFSFARVSYDLSFIHLNLNNTDTARSSLIDAVAVLPNALSATSNGQRIRLYGLCQLHLGILTAKECAFELSNGYLSAAREIFAHFDDNKHAGTSYLWLGINFIKQRRFNDAIPMLERAYALYSDIPNCELALANIATHLGTCYKVVSRYDKAINLLEQAYNIYAGSTNRQGIRSEEAPRPETTNISFGLGLCYLLSGNSQQAEFHLYPTLVLLRKSQIPERDNICKIMDLWVTGQTSLLLPSRSWLEISAYYQDWQQRQIMGTTTETSSAKGNSAANSVSPSYLRPAFGR